MTKILDRFKLNEALIPEYPLETFLFPVPGSSGVSGATKVAANMGKRTIKTGVEAASLASKYSAKKFAPIKTAAGKHISKARGVVLYGFPRIGFKIPQGVSARQFDRISAMIKSEVGSRGLGDDIFVMGSRAGGWAKAISDLDIGIRISAKEFDKLIAKSFPNAKNTRVDTMPRSIRDDRIQAVPTFMSKTIAKYVLPVQ